MADSNRERVKSLKRRLGSGNLTQSQFDRTINRIRRLGGKVAPGNFPTPSGASSNALSPFGQGVRFPSGLRRQIEQGQALGESFINRFLPNIETLGTVDEGRPTEITNLLNELRAVADTAGGRTQETADIISTLQGGLGGLSAEENNALRAQALDSINDRFQGGLRALSRLQGRSGVRGAAASAQFSDIAREKIGSTRAFENQLLADNIEVQDRRRNALAQLLQQSEAAEFGRGQAAREAFGSALTGVRADELARRQFNLDQQGKLLAGQQSLFFGGSSALEALRNANRNFRLGQENTAIARQNALNSAAANARLSSGLAGLGGGTQSQFPSSF